jgi:hypothetical protein
LSVPESAAGALVALTICGFVLRLVGINQSLYGDERYTTAIVTQNGLTGIWHQIYYTSITPPLHYYLAWLAVKLGGDVTALVRLPSLVLGTALIPLIFFLGRQAEGERTGLVAAAILALSPFAIFYSNEARAYETMLFLLALSTLALLKARESGGRAWWVVYAVASCAALWTHYVSIFVLVAEGAWALWTMRDRWRTVVLAEAAIAIGYLPWLPGYLQQRRTMSVGEFNQFAAVTPGTVFGFPLRTVIGHPWLGLTTVPGWIGLGMLGALAAVAVAAVASRQGWHPRVPPARSDAALVVILAVATPIGMLLYYALTGSDLLSAPRDVSASAPAAIVLISLVIVSWIRVLSARLAAVFVVALGAMLLAIAVKSVLPAEQRPAYRQVAHYLDAVAGNSAVVEFPLAVSPDQRLHQSLLTYYFKRPHRLYTYTQGDAAAWSSEHAGATLYYVMPYESWLRKLMRADPVPRSIAARKAELGGPDGRAIVRSTKRFAGFDPIAVERLQGAVTGSLKQLPSGLTIEWSRGPRVTVSPVAAIGEVSVLSVARGDLRSAGWAVVAGSHKPVDWFLIFRGRRLFAVSAGGSLEPTVARRFGRSALPSGYGMIVPGASAADRWHVFAVVGDRASELPVAVAGRNP